MARTETILRVFVASPGDVAEERAALEDVIRELNISWSRTVGISLEFVKWETHTHPGVGIDAQAVINEQLADDYDIFVGIMWATFGTRTGRAGSGTAEEFSRAYARHQENPDQIRIMFYFKDAPISPSVLDPDQLASIKAFQKELGDKGLYSTYTGREEFAQLVRMHLGAQVREWGKSWGNEPKEKSKSASSEHQVAIADQESIANKAEPPDEEPGYIDLQLSGQENFQTMNDAMARMTRALQDLGTRISERADELKRAPTPSGDVDLKQVKRISNRIAEEMNNFAALMEVEVPVFAGSYSSAIEAYTRAFTLTKDLGVEKKEDVEKTKDGIQQFQSALVSSQEQMSSFRETIANTPRATTMLNRARRRVLAILDQLDEEFTMALNLSSEIEKLFEQFLAG